MSDEDRNVWMRGRSASLIASQHWSMSAATARASPAMIGPRTRAGDLAHGQEVVGRGGREAGLDHVDTQARQLLGHGQLLRRGQRKARRLFAIAQGGIEKGDVVSHMLGYPVVVVRPCLFISARRSWPTFSIGSSAICSRYFVEVRPTHLVLVEPAVGERAVLDFREHLAHALLDRLVDDARA